MKRAPRGTSGMKPCAKCGLPVEWVRDPGGGPLRCLNADGTDHWDRCSAERFAAIKRDGEQFTEKRREGSVIGYRIGDREQLTHITPHKPSVGKHYREDGCTCGLPPWEICRADCEHSIRGTK